MKIENRIISLSVLPKFLNLSSLTHTCILCTKTVILRGPFEKIKYILLFFNVKVPLQGIDAPYWGQLKLAEQAIDAIQCSQPRTSL